MKKKKSSSKKRSQSTKRKTQRNFRDTAPLTPGNEAASVETSPLNNEESSELVQSENTSEADHIESISEEHEVSNDKTVEYAEKQEVVYSERTEETDKNTSLDQTEAVNEDATPEKNEQQDSNRQTLQMKDEEIERMAAVLSAVPAKEEPDEPMLFKKEKIRNTRYDQ